VPAIDGGVELHAQVAALVRGFGDLPHQVAVYEPGLAGYAKSVGSAMNRKPRSFKNYRFIVADPEWLGGKPAIRGTRLSVSHVLECLAVGMSVDEINESFGGGVSAEAIQEALQVAAELSDQPCVAA
jgi:uncharacterized protein (DUF433 family)